jgi:hypothetical protein
MENTDSLFEFNTDESKALVGAGRIISNLKKENEVLRNALIYIKDNPHNLSLNELIIKANNALDYHG